LIAKTLQHLRTQDWQLDIVGAGAAEAQVAALMAPFRRRVRMLGQVAPEDLTRHYAAASMLLWPGVNEAFGMSYLEAQAHGIPAVAQDRPGVRDVVYGPRADVDGGAAALAQQADAWLTDPAACHAAGCAARTQIGARHLRAAAAQTLSEMIAQVAA